MKIAIFTDNFYPELGGIQDSILQTVQSLGKMGHQICVYAPKASAKNFAVIGQQPHELDMQNVEIFRSFSLPYPSPTLQSRLAIPHPQIKRHFENFNADIVWMHTFFGLWLYGARLAQKNSIPLIGTNHWALSEFMDYVPLGKYLKDFFLQKVADFYQKCDFVSAPSQSVLDEMTAYGLTKPTKLISNPINLDDFVPLSNQTKRNKIKLQYGLSDFTVVFASRLAKEKRIEILIRAIAIAKKTIPNITLALAGHGSAKEEFEALAKELGIQKNVVFTGTLSKPDLADLFGASEVFGVASTSETQCMVLLQAMATGLPAVGVNARALPEYITHNVTGLIVEVENPQTFADAIIELYNHPEKREAFGKAGQKTVQRFWAEGIAKEWNTIFSDIIK